MLKLLLVTLATWSGVSVLLVGALGSLIHLREQRGYGRIARIIAHAVATKRSDPQSREGCAPLAKPVR